MFRRLFISFCLVAMPALSHAEDPPPVPIDDIEAEIRATEKQTPVTEQAAPENPRLESDQPAAITKESASSGEKIFDWDKHKGETEVKHPFAEKGLIRIGKDRTYYYKVKESVSNRAMSLQVGMINPLSLRNPDATDNATFADNYDQTNNPAFIFSKEWQIWRGALGKFGIRAGSGAFVAQGHGHFAGTTNVDLVPLETFTFIVMPNTLGAVYRMQFTHRPLFIPYVEGGAVGFTFAELRDDNKGPKFGASLAGYGAGGLALNLTYFDYLARIQLDHEYGITAVYLTAEYRRIQAIINRYDFTSDFFNAGFLMEY